MPGLITGGNPFVSLKRTGFCLNSTRCGRASEYWIVCQRGLALARLAMGLPPNSQVEEQDGASLG